MYSDLIARLEWKIQQTQSVFEVIQETALYNVALEEIYSCGDEEYLESIGSPLEFSQHQMEDGEVEIQQITQPPQQQIVTKYTLDQIRDFEIHDSILNLNILAETQAELEVHLDRHQYVYRYLRIFNDHLRYCYLYQKEDSVVESVKQTLILVLQLYKQLSEWLIAILQLKGARKMIYVELTTQPRQQYVCTSVLIYKDDRGRQQRNKEITITASLEMAYIMAEGWILSQLINRFLFEIVDSCSLKQVLIQLRGAVEITNPAFKTLLGMARQYFQQF